MGAQGTTTVDFGAFPGKSDASVAVTGQASIVAGSLVEAWMRLEATADHSADEHLLETVKVSAGLIVAGTGFTIYAINTSELYEPVNPPRSAPYTVGGLRTTGIEQGGGKGTRIYGLWTVAWVWN